MEAKETVVLPDDRPSFTAKVLLVEDNLTNQIVTRGLLNLFGIDAVLAENGQEGVEHARSQHFDLIFMDCQMPVMNGYDATKAIRQFVDSRTASDVTIIALSASAIQEEIDECFAVGMNDYLAKPISQNTLIAVLSKWLD
ncbi:response regulator [Marinomonas sp. IMCC 4694]|uniref:response regulator n=1 Tax=Marinomonas sp. IMCC 4694 TaxID=2605432 RepID=UPI0021CC73CA|nr:response regulator [Marinomonas sp. IMCC 4694]